MDRPRCRRCGGPLDLEHDVEDDTVNLVCNNPRPWATDAEFARSWEQLPLLDVDRLEKWLERYYKGILAQKC